MKTSTSSCYSFKCQSPVLNTTSKTPEISTLGTSIHAYIDFLSKQYAQPYGIQLNKIDYLSKLAKKVRDINFKLVQIPLRDLGGFNTFLTKLEAMILAEETINLEKAVTR